jgi:uncharacterized protein YegP (UPF0339 family)
MAARAEVFKRNDGRYGWRLIASNEQTIATDGGQGYENKSDATAMARRVKSGEWNAAPVVDA